MPLSVHDFLNPLLPSESFPPWGWLTTPELAQLCRTSQQSIYNWRLHRTGPPSIQDRSRRHYYRLADVLSWIERGARSPDTIITDWISSRFRSVIEWSRGQVQKQGGNPESALDHAIAFLETNKLVPRTRKPSRLLVPKYASAA